MLPEVFHPLDEGDVVSGSLASPASFVFDVHQAFEIGIIIDGVTERRNVDFEVTLGPGDVWLVPPWEPHGSSWITPRRLRLLVCFAPEFLGGESFDGASWLSMFAAAPRERPSVYSEDMRKRTTLIAQDLGREFREASVGWRSAVRQGLLTLLLHLYRSWRFRPDQTSLRACNAGNLARMTPALDLVRSNPAQRVCLAEAAAACSLSVTQFRLLFRQAMGATFGLFTLRVRLDHAARLLIHTNLSVEAISEQTGFTDHSHLHRAFNKVYGCAPGTYRSRASAFLGQQRS